MKLTESDLRQIVREELQNVIQEKKQLDELSFREDKMQELLSREPKLQRIQSDGGHSLERMFNQYVKRNKKLKRKYKQASPQA